MIKIIPFKIFRIMGKVYFVTGTDTGVGKTYITYWLSTFLKDRGLKVRCFKPIETGVSKIPEDAYLLSQATGQPLEEVIVYKFKNPLSPYAALMEEGGNIDINIIKESIRKLSEDCDLLFVEGAGGIAVPILKNYLYADLCKELELETIIVCRAGLGTINHTYLTWYFLKEKNIRIKAIILNRFAGKDISEKTNALIIEQLTGVKVFKVEESKNPPYDSFKLLIDHII